MPFGRSAPSFMASMCTTLQRLARELSACCRVTGMLGLAGEAPRSRGLHAQNRSHRSSAICMAMRTPLKIRALLSPMTSPSTEAAVRMVLATNTPPGFKTRLISAICTPQHHQVCAQSGQLHDLMQHLMGSQAEMLTPRLYVLPHICAATEQKGLISGCSYAALPANTAGASSSAPRRAWQSQIGRCCLPAMQVAVQFEFRDQQL